MGGELEKATLQEKSGTKSAIKTANSKEDLKRLADLVKETQTLGEKLENIKAGLSSAQQIRYMEAYKRLLDAVSDMN